MVLAEEAEAERLERETAHEADDESPPSACC
jgi:hypothetical protein